MIASQNKPLRIGEIFVKYDDMNYYQKRYHGALIVELLWEDIQTWNIPQNHGFYQDFIE